MLDPVVSRDGSLYVNIAQAWHDAGNFTDIPVFRDYLLPPMYFYLMKCLIHCGIPAETAGVSLSLFFGSLVPLIAYGIAWKVTRRKDIAICSALLIAVNPSINELSIEVQRDMMYLFFAGLTILFITAWIHRQKCIFLLGTGFLCACGILTRFEMIEFFLITPFVFAFLYIKKYCSWKNALFSFGVFVLSFGISIYFLSLIMKTQDYLFLNYDRYFQKQVHTLNIKQLPVLEDIIQI